MRRALILFSAVAMIALGGAGAMHAFAPCALSRAGLGKLGSGPASCAGRKTTKAFGFTRRSSSSHATTAASRTAGCVMIAASTSAGETQIPPTLSMSSLRPQ